MKPEAIKTAGYLVSSVSVALLGSAAWPGAEKAGLEAVLIAGMAASIAGMGMRWWSYEVERRSRGAAARSGPRRQDDLVHAPHRHGAEHRHAAEGQAGPAEPGQGRRQGERQNQAGAHPNILGGHQPAG